jgi:cytochrome b
MNNTKFRLGAVMMIALVSTIIGIGLTTIMLQHQSAYSVGGGVDDKRRTSVSGIQ